MRRFLYGMDKKIILRCEPEAAVVRRLAGIPEGADGGMEKLIADELAALRIRVEPAALVRQIRADQTLAALCCLPVGGELLAVLLSVGSAGDYVDGLFSRGEHLRAFVADALLSAWLFAMDEELLRELMPWCEGQGVGIISRLEAPGDAPMELQREICKRLDSERRVGVRVNDACMLSPEKSMCYLLRLRADSRHFFARHDCAKCQRADCAMRQ